MQQIYSLPPLATWVPVLNFAILDVSLPYKINPAVNLENLTGMPWGNFRDVLTREKSQAEEGNRTPDPLFTKQLLYRLSYFGKYLVELLSLLALSLSR